MKNETDVKALFSQRFLAFLLDFLIVTIFSAFVVAFIPVNSTLNKLYREQDKILENYVNGESAVLDYVNSLVDISYDISRLTVIGSIVSVVILILYYVVYPYYNNGQTLGKKLFKIRIKKVNDDNLSMNDLLIRAMINNSIFFSIVNIGLIIFSSKDMYLASSSFLTTIQYLVMFVSLIMIIFTKSKQGVHDKIVNTLVVNTNVVKEELVCQKES